MSERDGEYYKFPEMPQEFTDVMLKVWADLNKNDSAAMYRWTILPYIPIWNAALAYHAKQNAEAESLVRALKERSMLDPDAPNAIVFTSDAASE